MAGPRHFWLSGIGTHEAEWSIQVVVEARTQVRVERARLLDVAVLSAGPLPQKVLVEPHS